MVWPESRFRNPVSGRRKGASGRTIELVVGTVQLVINAARRDSQLSRGLGLVAAGSAKSGMDDAPLHTAERTLQAPSVDFDQFEQLVLQSSGAASVLECGRHLGLRRFAGGLPG